MRIYIDANYMCHLENAPERTAIETDLFDGKCARYISGHRFIPDGETWTRSDGVQFQGLMISPAVDYELLARIQAQYEEDLAQMSDMQTALEILGVTE